MAREKVLTTVPEDDDRKKVDAALRPKFLKEVIGQRKVAQRVDQLRCISDANEAA